MDIEQTPLLRLRSLRLLRQLSLLGVIIMCVTACDHKNNQATPSGDESATKWPKTHTVRVVPQDPRDVGHGDYKAQVIPMVVLDSGRVVSPIVQADYPRRGFMDSVYFEKRKRPANPIFKPLSGMVKMPA